MKMKKVFAFDLGKASIGYCVREGFDIKEVNSLIIEADHAEIASNRDRRRISRTLDAHKKREKFFNELWKNAGYVLLDKNDERFTKEFPKKNEDIIYTSCLLRIALLQNKPLAEWQIYKALYNAIQRRGYDASLPWANSSGKKKDEEENKKRSEIYTQENNQELISKEEYKSPCYYDALRLGLWSENNPTEFNKYISIDNQKVRTVGLVAPRDLVEKELKTLWVNAQKQLPKLKNISAEEFLYGEYKKAYASYDDKNYIKFRGTEHDAKQGVLAQKIPRFDNRIIMKCKLLPKRNVCKAADIENVTFNLLMKLRNLRLTDLSGELIMLTSPQIKAIYELRKPDLEKSIANKATVATINKSDIQKILGDRKVIGTADELKLKANLSGRSSFCRRALRIMNKIILEEVVNPVDLDITEFLDKPDSPNPITQEEIMTMLKKIGTLENLYVPDNRNEFQEQSSTEREKTDKVIGGITNPIVRNRLQIFRDVLLKLKKEYNEPDEIVFEFIRDNPETSLLAKEKAKDTYKYNQQQEKNNDKLREQLKDVNALSAINFDKLRLLEMQAGKCIYSGKNIGIADFEKCEIDHILPRAQGGNDALYNKVLCFAEQNQEKGNRTPYEWLRNNEENWTNYLNRVTAIKTQLGKKKYILLTGKTEEGKKVLEKYNALAETAQIARVAQKITAFIFGWGLQTVGDKRKIFVSNGANTASIRRQYGLNRILGDDKKKNRENDKHHALDAICISFFRDYKYNSEKNRDEIAGFNPEVVKREIDKLVPYPYANDKPFKGNLVPKETIYGKRERDGKTYLVGRSELSSIGIKQNKFNKDKAEKDIKKIWDKDIKQDLQGKLIKMTEADFVKELGDYKHPKKKTNVKKVMFIEKEDVHIEKDANGRERAEEFVDFGHKGTFGQFKLSKGHKGQILYFDQKGAIRVMPVYANQKEQAVRDKLLRENCKLYNDGEIFYTGCLIDIPLDFKAGKDVFPAGIYKSSSINMAGQAYLESSSGERILTSVKYLSKVNFRKYKKA